MAMAVEGRQPVSRPRAMKKLQATLVCLVAFSGIPLSAQSVPYPFNDPDLPVEKRIDNLLSLMTIDEKVACLGTNTSTGKPRESQIAAQATALLGTQLGTAISGPAPSTLHPSSLSSALSELLTRFSTTPGAHL